MDRCSSNYGARKSDESKNEAKFLNPSPICESQTDKLKQRLKNRREGRKRSTESRKRPKLETYSPCIESQVKYTAHKSGASISISRNKLSQDLFEVELVLRKGINDYDDMEDLSRRSKICLSYFELLGSSSIRCGCSMGSLFRALLPYDSDSHIDRQTSLRRIDIKLLKSIDKKSLMDEATINNLLEGALLLRNTLRIKISDDGDLITAKSALNTIQVFLKSLLRYLKENHYIMNDEIRSKETNRLVKGVLDHLREQ